MTVDFWPALAAILLMTGICFTLFRLVYQPSISRWTLCFSMDAMAFCYFTSSFSKAWASEVSTGTSLAPSLKTYFSILLYWSSTSHSFTTWVAFSFSWKKLSLFVGAILLVEACQFFFSLGFFDLGDILLNTSGFALGNFLGQSAIAQSFKNRIQKKWPRKVILYATLPNARCLRCTVE